jgi:hypothetical protein
MLKNGASSAMRKGLFFACKGINEGNTVYDFIMESTVFAKINLRCYVRATNFVFLESEVVIDKFFATTINTST